VQKSAHNRPPDKFNLIPNLKTTKVLEIEFPALLLARADEEIE
jgi:hypothetical protein